MKRNGGEVADRFQRVIDRIRVVAQECGRAPEAVRLVVVTKTHPLAVVREVIAAGATHIGENYAEEAQPKIQAIQLEAQGVSWHMIGHIQSRKAKLVCELFDYVHSLDSLKLAGRLDRHAGMLNKKLPVLLECNVSGEESKYGWALWREDMWEPFTDSVASLLQLAHLEIQGLMTVAPYFEDPELARPYYRKLHQLQTFLINRFPQVNWRELSMGMSADYEVAIQEGATWIRIGQSILGPRRVAG